MNVKSSDVNGPRFSAPMGERALQAALGKGAPQEVLALIGAGANIRYKRDNGYDALDAVHGRDIARDPRLLELLALLVAHGVDVSSARLKSWPGSVADPSSGEARQGTRREPGQQASGPGASPTCRL